MGGSWIMFPDLTMHQEKCFAKCKTKLFYPPLKWEKGFSSVIQVQLFGVTFKRVDVVFSNKVFSSNKRDGFSSETRESMILQAKTNLLLERVNISTISVTQTFLHYNPFIDLIWAANIPLSLPPKSKHNLNVMLNFLFHQYSETFNEKTIKGLPSTWFSLFLADWKSTTSKETLCSNFPETTTWNTIIKDQYQHILAQGNYLESSARKNLRNQ